MRQCCPPDRAPYDMDLQELDKLRTLSDHPEIATVRAMDYCATHNICPPTWLVASAASLMIELLKREKTSKRGRTASCLARFRQEFWDLERWDAVNEVRRVRGMARRDDEALKTHPKQPVTDAWRRGYQRRRKWLKLGTFECATYFLAGRDAHATASAIRTSYRKIEKSLVKASPLVGAWFDDAFLRKLGMQGLLDRKPGAKTFLFFDLT
jgi:hypothetical protein